MDIVRVLRIVEYVGPRDLIEKQIEQSIHGTKNFGPRGLEITIRAATIGGYPEILGQEEINGNVTQS